MYVAWQSASSHEAQATYPRTDLNRDEILAAITKGISWSQLAKKEAERYLMHQISMVNHGIHYCHWAYISCTMILNPTTDVSEYSAV